MLKGEEALNFIDALHGVSGSRTYLHAVTSGKDKPLDKAREALERLQVSIQLLLWKGDPLPHLHRGRPIVESDENNLPHTSPKPCGIGMEPFHQQIHPQKGEEHGSESHDGHNGRLLASPP